ncbi:uncharacterized protein LOC115629510 [Scaptodrosophila lebanonensis]|uniref:Uncharacterized protein LOC115629510 n=1 Tax=Drosophila lebanonensis TaxID=7225 RepID=A0A6J2TZE4_DROLE|nr:uncharacterized protein LOC115629510 [Scaptodrosophila lebanonensis]XP_030381852.1 uncharacterized protein LOC115629510 [Scaptodrosophila lebanonensis]
MEQINKMDTKQGDENVMPLAAPQNDSSAGSSDESEPSDGQIGESSERPDVICNDCMNKEVACLAEDCDECYDSSSSVQSSSACNSEMDDFFNPIYADSTATSEDNESVNQIYNRRHCTGQVEQNPPSQRRHMVLVEVSLPPEQRYWPFYNEVDDLTDSEDDLLATPSRPFWRRWHSYDDIYCTSNSTNSSVLTETTGTTGTTTETELDTDLDPDPDFPYCCSISLTDTPSDEESSSGSSLSELERTRRRLLRDNSHLRELMATCMAQQRLSRLRKWLEGLPELKPQVPRCEQVEPFAQHLLETENIIAQTLARLKKEEEGHIGDAIDSSPDDKPLEGNLKDDTVRYDKQKNEIWSEPTKEPPLTHTLSH